MNEKFKKIYIFISMLSIVILVSIFALVFNIKKSIDIKSNNEKQYEFKNEYKNNGQYFKKGRKENYRNVEYIGGINLYLDRKVNLSPNEYTYEGTRWYPFYRDKDTGEVLRGFEKYNYITTGIPYVGIDYMDVPKERMTKKGFQEYVLNWTGTVLYRKIGFIDDKKRNESFYGKNIEIGVYECKENLYDIPIDLVANNFLSICNNKNELYENKNIEKIDNIQDAISYNYISQSIFFSENHWIFNILRNCFGFISDDFYNIQENNILNFNECDIEDVEIGDIGVYDYDGYALGICVGFDSKNNPIFSICTSYDVNNKITELNSEELINKLKEITKNKYIGYNILHIENIKEISKNAFNKYYKTFLPFIDEDEIGSAKNRKLIIKDINTYNKNAFLVLESTNGNNRLYNQLINERERRIERREKQAKDLLERYNINLNKYKDIDVSTVFIIDETNTYEYETIVCKNIINSDDRDNYKRKDYADTVESIRNNLKDYGKDFTKEQIEKIYIENNDNLNKFIIENKNKLKGHTENDINEWFYTNGGMTEFELNMLKRYLNDYPEILD
ncbi:MAG: hypothetical protein Q4F88_03620 [Eubacteriales bacterium]|nr:hypothetical protein [Eubacteriales bacterium]